MVIGEMLQESTLSKVCNTDKDRIKNGALKLRFLYLHDTYTLDIV